MIVKRNFHPQKVWPYIQKPVSFTIIWASLVWLVYFLTDAREMAINFTPIGVLGSALAIFVAFRNNSAYGRWWEARQHWAGIVNSSRVLARLIITFTDSHKNQENYEAGRSEAFKGTMVFYCIAWAHALRLHLRRQDHWDEVTQLIPEEDQQAFLQSQNKVSFLHLAMGKRIYTAMGDGTLGGFDSFQMEGQLLALTNYHGGCEKIKDTPLPRQYDFFTRVFVGLFSALLPFGILGFFQSSTLYPYSWLTIPFTVLVAGVFIIMERTGAANEAPFENQVTDVPLSALCNTIERDLKEMLQQKDLPPKLEPVEGYLF